MFSKVLHWDYSVLANIKCFTFSFSFSFQSFARSAKQQEEGKTWNQYEQLVYIICYIYVFYVFQFELLKTLIYVDMNDIQFI